LVSRRPWYAGGSATHTLRAPRSLTTQAIAPPFGAALISLGKGEPSTPSIVSAFAVAGRTADAVACCAAIPSPTAPAGTAKSSASAARDASGNRPSIRRRECGSFVTIPCSEIRVVDPLHVGKREAALVAVGTAVHVRRTR